MTDDAPAIQRVAGLLRAHWHALGGPCELLLDSADEAHARELASVAAGESRRIERKYSRYRDDSVIAALHAASGAPVTVDDETAMLLDYAEECHALSAGRFDITSGVLRRIWRFDGGDRVPSEAAVRETLAHLGWGRVQWQRPRIVLPAGMELDLGGIGKEYAVDRAASRVAPLARAPFLVNFGGDLFAPGPRANGGPWQVAIDDPERTGQPSDSGVSLERGGLATSGDARRFVRHRGRRLGHILDPRTGWPVEGAPHSVTVCAASCLEAGTLATLAVLEGPGAERFLEGAGVVHHVVRGPAV